MRFTVFIAAVFFASALCAQQAQRPPASQTERMYQFAAESAQRKFQHIIANSRRNPPDQTPTVLLEREINAYVNDSKYIKLPTGVQSVRFHGRPGVIDAVARVDFDQITASRRESNPLLMLFSGVHDVHVVANAQASGGRGRVEIQNVDIDGVSVPRMALEFFISHYLTPKYPEVGMTSTFNLGYRVDTARIGNGTMMITQK
ncbi:MAG: hypothetical protein ACRD3E_07220 [Terriglobales bacterium]